MSNANMTAEFSCRVLACGAWGEGFEQWSELSQLLSSSDADLKESKGPKPEIIPANERRRAPLSVRLAVESSWQAAQNAQIDPKELTCVFVSGLGDTQLTDYMCKVLAGETKELSPTKFHNSVHNAAAGYWTISTGCEKAANSVAGFQNSVSLALMEAMLQCQQEHKTILLTFFDAPVSKVLEDIMGSGTSFAFSMIIAPADQGDSAKPILAATISTGSSEWPELLQAHDVLKESYQKNPSARILTLAEMLLGVGNGKRVLPMNEHISLFLSIDSQ